MDEVMDQRECKSEKVDLKQETASRDFIGTRLILTWQMGS